MLQDLTIRQKYLVAFTVGYNQRNIIDAAVKKVNILYRLIMTNEILTKLC